MQTTISSFDSVDMVDLDRRIHTFASSAQITQVLITFFRLVRHELHFSVPEDPYRLLPFEASLVQSSKFLSRQNSQG